MVAITLVDKLVVYAKKITINRLAWIVSIAFFISITPLLWLSFYAHPTADDYGFSSPVYHAVSAGGNILSIAKAVADKVVFTYFNWQGSYAAIALFTLQPGAFNENFYFLTTFIMLGGLICSMLFFMDTLIVKWLHMRRAYVFLVSMPLLFMQIQFLPSIEEAFFWFNGSSYYTLFYSFALVFFALIARIILAEKMCSKVILTFAASLLAVLIGGGNLATGLCSFCVLFFVLLCVFCRRHASWKFLLIVLAVLAAGFAVNILAPGNAVRATCFGTPNPVKAVILSFLFACSGIGKWLNLSGIIALLFISPVLYAAARSCRWNFQYPLAAFALAFCLWSCQFTPPLYAMGGIGPGRLLNVYYYSMTLMLVFDLFYLFGWFIKKYGGICPCGNFKTACEQNLPVILLSLVFLFGCGSLQITARKCMSDLRYGRAKQYDLVVRENIKKLKSGGEVCYIRNVKNKPKCLPALSVSEDETFWINAGYAGYYGCKAVRLQKEE